MPWRHLVPFTPTVSCGLSVVSLWSLYVVSVVYLLLQNMCFVFLSLSQLLANLNLDILDIFVASALETNEM